MCPDGDTRAPRGNHGRHLAGAVPTGDVIACMALASDAHTCCIVLNHLRVQVILLVALAASALALLWRMRAARCDDGRWGVHVRCMHRVMPAAACSLACPMRCHSKPHLSPSSGCLLLASHGWPHHPMQAAADGLAQDPRPLAPCMARDRQHPRVPSPRLPPGGARLG